MRNSSPQIFAKAWKDVTFDHTCTHTGERPFPCDEDGCEYSAAKPGTLTAHKRTHSDDRPYACNEPGCAYSATKAGNLKRHKNTHVGSV
ncbi:hypothetical protein T492DRAFT_630016 [Pavlovales sp. CCMP2436]|nr:hypothetical protein T492DRAFT_630016 [Pavlovales sp. CCMP2436]